MSYVKGLRCRECGKEYPKAPIHVCEFCFGPLEVTYEYDEIKRVFSRDVIKNRSSDIWRYAELLPLDKPNSIGKCVGFTPLLKADNLARILGVREIYVKKRCRMLPYPLIQR
jgi:threonine synthase